MEKILIADDEQLMRQLVVDFLQPEGYELIEAADGKEALELYKKEHPDLVLLDVMMPGYDGWTVCREIRRESAVPIMMLTAKGEEIDQLFAYDLGVDEYITKPFSPKILVAKIKALLRRVQKEQEVQKIEDGVSIDQEARQVVLDGKNIDLSPTEYKLLTYLVSNAGKALSRRQILTICALSTHISTACASSWAIRENTFKPSAATDTATMPNDAPVPAGTVGHVCSRLYPLFHSDSHWSHWVWV